MTGLIVWFVICVILSAFFSGSEMAFVSSDRLKMRKLADAGNKAAARVLNFYKDQELFLAAILIGNNIVNVGATVILTYMLSVSFGIESEWLVTLIMTPLILIFGEIVPKDYCRMHARQYLLTFSGVMEIFCRAVSWISRIILGAVRLLMRPLGIRTNRGIFVNEEEFRSLILESTKTGVVGHHEKKIIDTILDFEKIRVESVMIPLEQIAKVEITQKVGDVKDLARDTSAEMVLVYEEIQTLVVGMVYVFDLLFEEKTHLKLQPYLRAPVFIPKHTSIEKAFFTLQQKHQSYAVVIDENSEVVGVVPIERLIAV